MGARSVKKGSVKAAVERLTQEERTARSDRKMCAVALQLICENGAQNTTLKEIGERAGFSRGLAGNRFGTKEFLFERLIIEFNTKWRQAISRAVDKGAGIDALCTGLDVVCDFLREDPNHMKAIYVLWFESIASHSRIRERLAGHHTAYRNDVERWLRRGITERCVAPDINPKTVAEEYLAFIFGIIYQWMVSPADIEIVDALKGFKTTLRHRYQIDPSDNGFARTTESSSVKKG
ncbi:MAG: TetR/AcrR family transcriptional regulator [Parasphingopyxis sp.]|uniref:TetR/AcrR family transcriptional regulator n=1 Tax=Parasphingopyxis sp. TaxID=1920299 RepID=UPI003FA04F86